MNLKDKVVIVTGASSGIGQAIAIAFADKGAKVVFTYNSNKKGADQTLKKLSPDAVAVKMDMQSESDINNLFKTVKSKFGHLDVLINNAGGNKAKDLYGIKGWRDTLDTNLLAQVLCTQKGIEMMKTSGGKIINISSIYGEGKAASRNMPAYSAAKAALNNFTQTTAKLVAPKILVNAIAPGYVFTPSWGRISEKYFKDSANEQLIEKFVEASDIAQMTVAVAENDGMTGEIVVVDGGISLKTVFSLT